MDYTQYAYGQPNAAGQGAATPGASSSSSGANAAAQARPQGDPYGAILASAQAWAARKQPKPKSPPMARPPQPQPGNTGINPNAPPPIPNQWHPTGEGPVPNYNGQPIPVSTGPYRVPPGQNPFGGGYGPPPSVGPVNPMPGGYPVFDGAAPISLSPPAPPYDPLAKQQGRKIPAPRGIATQNGKFAPTGGINDGTAVPAPPKMLGGPPLEINAANAKQKDGQLTPGDATDPDNPDYDATKDPTSPTYKPATTQGGNTHGGGSGGSHGQNQPEKPMDQWLIDESNRLSSTPGFEFLKSPAGKQIYAMYAAEQQGDGTFGKGPTFAEWASKNWEAAAGKAGMSAEDQKNFGYFVRQTGYQQQATRMVNEYKQKGGKGDTSWVTGDKIRQYEEWARGNPKANLDFWTWAGTVNQGINPWDNGKPIAPPPAAAGSGGNPFYQQWLANHPGEAQHLYGQGNTSGASGSAPPPPPSSGSGSGGETNGKTHTEAGGGVEDDPNSPYLKRLEDAMKERQKYVMGEADRSFQAQAALKGLGNTGAFGDAYGRFMNDASSNFNEQLAKPVFDAYEQEQTRRNQAAMSRYQSDSSLAGTKYGADTSAGSAHAMAGASLDAAQYNAQLDYNLGLQQLGLQASNSDWDRQQWLMQMLATLGPEQMLQQMFGSGNQYLPGFAWQQPSGG